MESHENFATVESLCEYIKALDTQRRSIRGVNNSALLIPVEAVLDLLNTSLREVMRAARIDKPYIPTDKTLLKILKEPHQLPTRGTLLRLLKDVPHQLMLQSLTDQDKDGYVWMTGEAWNSLFSSPLFIHHTSRDFWKDFVRDAKTLNAVDMHADKSYAEKLRVYADSPQVGRFGCSTVRPVLHAWLNQSLTGANAEGDQVIQHVMIADKLAVLLRMLAWLVADMVVDIWEMFENEEMQDIIPLDSFLPAIDPSTDEWCNPTTRALEQLAKRAGWQGKQRAITFLGNLWDRHDSTEKEPGSRTRLLRNWEQRRKGRPKFETFCSLAHAVTVEQALLAEESPEGRDYDTWMQAVILRIGESLSELLYALIKLGVEPCHIRGIMDAYRQEYRFAREALGKPMGQVENETAKIAARSLTPSIRSSYDRPDSD